MKWNKINIFFLFCLGLMCSNVAPTSPRPSCRLNRPQVSVGPTKSIRAGHRCRRRNICQISWRRRTVRDKVELMALWPLLQAKLVCTWQNPEARALWSRGCVWPGMVWLMQKNSASAPRTSRLAPVLHLPGQILLAGVVVVQMSIEPVIHACHHVAPLWAPKQLKGAFLANFSISDIGFSGRPSCHDAISPPCHCTVDGNWLSGTFQIPGICPSRATNGKWTVCLCQTRL